jgi:hypothetical protein
VEKKVFSDKFCQACGGGLISTAAICTHCGTPFGVVPGQMSSYTSPVKPPKSKTTAVVLAVFFGAWAWLYTYSWNSKKFWYGVPGLWGAQLLFFAFEFFVGKSLGWFGSYYFWLTVNSLAGLGVWLWSLIGNAKLQQSELNNYPNR